MIAIEKDAVGFELVLEAYDDVGQHESPTLAAPLFFVLKGQLRGFNLTDCSAGLRMPHVQDFLPPGCTEVITLRVHGPEHRPLRGDDCC